MSKGLIFFCCACAIFLFTIINLSVGPIISEKVGKDYFSVTEPGTSNTLNINFRWGTANCKLFSDFYDIAKKLMTGNALKYTYERGKNECQNKKAMHDMEYTSFIFNVVIGFVCGLLGLLHLCNLKKEFVPKTGLIGLGCGIIGFIFSFVYVVLNGLVYTTYYDYVTVKYKRDSDGAFAEKKGDHFECFYHDSPENNHAIYAKYSDLIQKQYNYDKDLIDSYNSNEVSQCIEDPDICLTDEKIPLTSTSLTIVPAQCKYLYLPRTELEYTVTNKDKSDRFLTTLLLSLFVCMANIGLGIFGFLLYRTPGDF